MTLKQLLNDPEASPQDILALRICLSLFTAMIVVWSAFIIYSVGFWSWALFISLIISTNYLVNKAFDKWY